MALQVFSDGGFARAIGAAAFVLVCVRYTDAGFQADLIGGRGIVVHGARSPFHMEVTALDIATQYLKELSRTLF